MTVLILGATGNLGSLTASALLALSPSTRLRLTSSRESGVARLKKQFPSADVLLADWYDPSSLGPAFEGVDKVFMVTPDFVTDESQATPNVIEAVRCAGTVSQIVRLIAIPPGMSAADLDAEFIATRCGANLHVIAKPLLDASGLPVTYVNAACWIMFNLPWFLASEVKATRRLTMPETSDASRLLIAEEDIAGVVALVLSEDPAKHVGKEYLLTGQQRYDFRQIAEVFSEIVGEKVTFADDDAQLRATMGEHFETLTTYFKHETRDYGNVPVTDTVQQLLGRPPVTLNDYVLARKSLFI